MVTDYYASSFAIRFYRMHFTNNNCRYIVRDDVTLKGIDSVLIYREVLH